MGKRPSAPPAAAPCGRVRVCVWSVGALSIPWKLLDRFRAETLDFFFLSLSLSRLVRRRVTLSPEIRLGNVSLLNWPTYAPVLFLLLNSNEYIIRSYGPVLLQ